MLEGIFDAIHAERKMSLTHWRYRLLHWAFAVDPDTVWKDHNGCHHSKLPSYLYSHYCPLFHLTNLIALFSPIILSIKLIWAIILISGIVCKKIFHGIKKGIAAAQALRPQPTPEDNEVILQKFKERTKQQELRSIPGLLAKYAKTYDDSCLDDFEHFYRYITEYHSHDNPFETVVRFAPKDEIKKIWDECVPKVKAAQEAHTAHVIAMRKRILFWVNFSRMFIKGTLNLFYFALLAVVLYFTYRFGWPVLKYVGGGIASMFAFLITLDWLGNLIGFGKFLLRVLIGMTIVCGSGWLIYKFVPLNLLWQKTCPPFKVVSGIFLAICRYIKNIVVGTCEFVSLFYEENCPPITIIDDSEAAITEEMK